MPDAKAVMRNKLVVSNVTALGLIAWIWWLNQRAWSAVALLLILALINVVRIYSWSQMTAAETAPPIESADEILNQVASEQTKK